MENKQQLIDEFTDFVSFVEKLRRVDHDKWNTPIAKGKWSPKEIIAHIAFWDKFFLEEFFQKINSGEKVIFQLPDFEIFNRRAIDWAKEKSKSEIIDLTIQYRNEVIYHINSFSEKVFTKEHNRAGNYKISAYTYLTTFIPHDQHHMTQIKKHLNWK